MTFTPGVSDGRDSLWFRKLPSGGRGEYEVSGKQDSVTARDLVDRRFVLHTPFGDKMTNVYLGTQGAKMRLRRVEPQYPQLARQLAAMLLLPKSTRSESAVSSALPVVLESRYIMDVRFRLTDLTPDSALVDPNFIVARSGDIKNFASMEWIDVHERFVRIRNIYAHSASLDSNIRSLVTNHEHMMKTRDHVGLEGEKLVSELLLALDSLLAEVDYLPGADPLPALEFLCGIHPLDLDVPEPPNTPAASPEVRLRAEHIYRARRVRGTSASDFKKAVQAAYDFRCLFCGLRAPHKKGRAFPGVDAAHILPWGTYDLDVVQNGIMLCKQHHWAFDNHILVLEVNDGTYSVSLAEDIDQYLNHDPETLEILNKVAGPIPESRLPKLSDRPRAEFLAELYGN